MAEGQEQIDNALKLARELTEGWKGRSEEIVQRLKKVATTLEGLSGKLFLKTKAAVPHTSAILKAAEDLKNSTNTSGNKPSDEFNDALDQLESEVEILRNKMANRDIVIT
jgi:hypothetical protein